MWRSAASVLPSSRQRSTAPNAAKALLDKAIAAKGGLAKLQSIRTVHSEGTMIVMPADHVIQPTAQFQKAVADAVAVIADEPATLVLFGVEPTYPATGFGYIQRGDRVATRTCPTYRVKSFQENQTC